MKLKLGLDIDVNFIAVISMKWDSMRFMIVTNLVVYCVAFIVLVIFELNVTHYF